MTTSTINGQEQQLIFIDENTDVDALLAPYMSLKTVEECNEYAAARDEEILSWYQQELYAIVRPNTAESDATIWQFMPTTTALPYLKTGAENTTWDVLDLVTDLDQYATKYEPKLKALDAALEERQIETFTKIQQLTTAETYRAWEESIWA